MTVRGKMCLNDIFAYCLDEPEPQSKAVDVIVTGQPNKGGRYKTEMQSVLACKKDKATCGFYQTNTEFFADASHKTAKAG